MIRSRFALVFIFAVATSAMAQSTDGVDAIVDAIRTLEGKSDPKCHATATRLENFMYGTPLSENAREKKVILQKALILDLWKQASTRAANEGNDDVSGDLMQKLIRERLAYEVTSEGHVAVPLGEGREIELIERDVRQYSSVAYALRAILAVQQDVLLDPTLSLRALSPEAISELKRFIDIRTLAALSEGDRLARSEDRPEVDDGIFTRAWNSIGTAPAQISIEVASAPRPSEVLRRIIRQKLASFSEYNKVSDPLFYSNTRVFYARHEWPSESEKIQEVTREFSRVMMNFVAAALIDSEKRALGEESPIIRERHVSETWAHQAPFRINEFEDVLYFYNLPREQQISIEAYDADSFRDSGLHWLLIQQVIDHPSMNLRTDADPFAAELLAEGVAQMGVLVFRVAGGIAREEGAPALAASHVAAAETEIARRMKLQLETPERAPAPQARRIASAPSRTSGDRFFTDTSDSSGIDFVHRTSDWLSRFQRSFLYSTHGAPDSPRPGGDAAAHDVAPSFSGSGVAAEDVNGDGIHDVLMVGGAGNRLYLGSGEGIFTDATEAAGISPHGSDGHPGEPRQPLIADFDNDGFQDILITYVNAPHRLYRGHGDGRFTDVTKTAGLGGEGLVGGPAAVFDYDNDGRLDVYIGYYGNYVKGDGPNLARRNDNASPNRLFRNEGDMRFTDVTASSGTGNRGWTQAVTHVDLDADGWQDLIVGNDFGVNAWYRNQGDGTFVDVASEWGTDLPSNAMNVGVAELNGDTYPEIYISNILTMVKDEKYVLPSEDTRMKLNYQKLSTMRIVGMNHLFASVANESGVRRYELSEAVDRGETATGWAWDADFFDFDLDGDDDLYVTNGLNEYNQYAAQFAVDREDGTRQTWMFSVHPQEKNVFFVNETGKLRNRSSESGADFSGNSRSAAYVDIDYDGDLDIVVNNFHSPATVLRNESASTDRNWLKLSLVGDPDLKTPRDAIGARVEVRLPDGRRLVRWIQGGTGYLSMHPREQHFGLGSAGAADVTVIWPGGVRQELGVLDAGVRWSVTQGQKAKPLRQPPVPAPSRETPVKHAQGEPARSSNRP